MELINIMNELHNASIRLDKASKQIFEISKQSAEAEREYRKALAQEIIMLKATGVQTGLILDIAKGNVSDLLYKRDLKEGLYMSSKESIRAIETQISALQTISRHMNEL